MRILLVLFCLITLAFGGCNQQTDPLEFDRIVSLAYSNLTITSELDSSGHTARKEAEFKLIKVKKEKDSLKADSCKHRIDCSTKVM
ncbi:hypothetical protein H7F33_13505 [Pedobacter sp. PAMC26386]|nr:hypothetical protein H7F33_13505 [Pedobacter sp. PAMC26386]